MKIVFYVCFIHHHLVWVADELYRLTNGGLRYVCIQDLPDIFKRTGYPDYYDRPYIIKAYERNGYTEAERLALEADVAIFHGSEDVQHFRDLRLRIDKLSFESGERWLKRGWLNIFSPRLIKSQIRYHFRYKKCINYYSLNASAFLLDDYKKLHSFRNRCFKWGYFTKIDEIDVHHKTFEGNRIMWVNRFIDWKHPEMPILLAKKLKRDGYVFCLDMYGSGKLYNKIIELAESYDVSDSVRFNGTLPNEELRKEMSKHDIVLTTSDQNEGWGATVNEAMSNGCVCVCSSKVGSVPFLVKDGVNGLVFKSHNIDSLYNCVVSVLGKTEKCKKIAEEAYITMRDLWSPENAAKSLIMLSNCLLNGNEITIKDGPCSKDI